MIEAVGLTRSFGGTPVLRGVDLRIERGEFVALIGPSGCGKTTLLALLGGMDRPSAGSVSIDGADLAKVSSGQRARIRRRIGVVFQHSHMVARLPVWENVAYPLVARGVPAAARRERAMTWLAEVGLEDRADARPEELSGGELRRVGVARALAGEPDILLADEPTSDLDEHNAGIVRSLLHAFHAGGGTLLVATHDVERDAASARRIQL